MSILATWQYFGILNNSYVYSTIETQVDEEEDRIWQTIHQLSLAPLQISQILQNLDFISRKVMVMVKVMVFKTFEGALRLAAGAFFFSEKKTYSWKNDIP